jgi:hypothetical protein
VQQSVIATLGRTDALAASGALASLLASGARFCDQVVLIEACKNEDAFSLCRLERGGRLYHRLGIDVDRQVAVFDYGPHRHFLLPAPARDGRAAPVGPEEMPRDYQFFAPTA